MRKIMLLAAFAMVFAFAGQAMADGAGTYASKCKSCHGATGEGGTMAPALKGSAFVKGDAAAVKATIKNGRSGAEKKYVTIPLGMPKFADMSDADLDALVTYLKGL